MHRGRLAALLAAVAVALAAPLPAQAGYWHWGWGVLVHDGPDRDGPCLWYPRSATCAGWNYWHFQLTRAQYWVSYGRALVGFENGERVRGQWIYNADMELQVAPREVGMGGYLKATDIHWEGDGVYMHAEAIA